MTWESLEAFQQEMEAIISTCQSYLYATRAIEDQQASVGRLNEIEERVQAAKEKAIGEANEPAANYFLWNQYILEALRWFTQMWVLIKQDDMDAAWDALIMAQGATRHALLVENNTEIKKLNERLHRIEEVVFPPQMFASTRFTILEAKCNICNATYGECDHIKNRIYMGKLCTRIITKWQLEEVSIVDDPASKHCRATSYSDGKHNRNYMTGRIIPNKHPQPSAEHHHSEIIQGEMIVMPSVPYEEE